MIKRAIDDGLPPGVVLADTGYGSSSDFRQELRGLGLDYAVAVEPNTLVWLLDAQAHCRGDPVPVRDLAMQIEARGGFRRCTWRKATKQDLSARFALRRVAPAGRNAETEAQWLLIRVARRPERTRPLFPRHPARGHHQATAHPAGHATLAH